MDVVVSGIGKIDNFNASTNSMKDVVYVIYSFQIMMNLHSSFRLLEKCFRMHWFTTVHWWLLNDAAYLKISRSSMLKDVDIYGRMFYHLKIYGPPQLRASIKFWTSNVTKYPDWSKLKKNNNACLLSWNQSK